MSIQLCALGLVSVGSLTQVIYQLDVPLGGTARGDYVIAIEALRGGESTRTLVPIRVR